jgi:hypothetical protein
MFLISLENEWSRRSGLNGRPADYESSQGHGIIRKSSVFKPTGCNRMQYAAIRCIPGASRNGSISTHESGVLPTLIVSGLNYHALSRQLSSESAKVGRKPVALTSYHAAITNYLSTGHSRKWPCDSETGELTRRMVRRRQPQIVQTPLSQPLPISTNPATTRHHSVTITLPDTDVISVTHRGTVDGLTRAVTRWR